MGVKPSDADLSEDDFMQSNGEQVEEPGIQKLGKIMLSLNCCFLLKCGRGQGGAINEDGRRLPL